MFMSTGFSSEYCHVDVVMTVFSRSEQMHQEIYILSFSTIVIIIEYFNDSAVWYSQSQFGVDKKNVKASSEL